ncbi:hypothetical protein DPMN_094304 [Dreissena polymorpha]|uniref:Uncharacterized protein n=1 Tax=Dreissena polymorpha TaxID=45954 RepID=A0A9D4R2K2_DREPO|nr:hypothetical protein DPMN_094304 [Dreissena polymorpha]
MECTRRDNVVFVFIRKLPNQWERLHTSAQIECRQNVLLSNLLSSQFRLFQKFCNRCIVRKRLIYRSKVVDCGFSIRTVTGHRNETPESWIDLSTSTTANYPSYRSETILKQGL